jgi:hypothetical protein
MMTAMSDGSRRQESAAERAVREANIAHAQAEQQRLRDAEIAAELAEESDKARATIAETIDWRGTPEWDHWHVARGIPEAAYQWDMSWSSEGGAPGRMAGAGRPPEMREHPPDG